VTEEADRSPAVRRPRELELRVNPIACEAHGLCVQLIPELVAADPWGYPIIRPGPVPLRLLSLARRAVADCPTLALRLADYQATRPESDRGHASPGR
jgi:ferredoxin